MLSHIKKLFIQLRVIPRRSGRGGKHCGDSRPTHASLLLKAYFGLLKK